MIIFVACALTVAIETPLFLLWGYRDRSSVTIVVCANIVTNLLLNLTISTAFCGSAGAWVYLLEAFVVAAEFAVYGLAFGASWKLFLQTLVANCASYCIGLLIF